MKRFKKIIQWIFVLIGIGAAAAAGYVFVDSNTFVTQPSLMVSPPSGPSGIHPFATLEGVPAGSYALNFCVGSDCTKVGQLGVGKPVRLDALRAPQRGVYRLEVEGLELPLKANFKIVAFQVERSISTQELPPKLELEDAKQLGRPGSCPPYVLPDGRLLIGTTVFDPASGITVDLQINAAEIAWSLDGKRMAIIVADRKEIRLADPDGENATTVVREARGFLSSLSWTQDSNRLAFVTRPDPAVSGGPRQPTVQIVDVTSRQIVDGGPGVAVAASHTSGAMAIQSGSEIFLSDLGAPTNRTSLATGERPTISSDGSVISYIRGGEAFFVRVGANTETPLNLRDVCGVAVTSQGVFATAAGDKTVSLHPFAR